MRTVKRACSKEPFTFDWRDFFAELNIDESLHSITSSTWILSGGSLGPQSVIGTKTTAVIDGGVVGEMITLKNIIEINGGQYRDCATLNIEVI